MSIFYVGEAAEKKLEFVKAILLALPKANYCMLKRLIEFMAFIATHEKATKMGIVNLATLLGPNLIWDPRRAQGGNDISTPTQIAFFLIANAKELFAVSIIKSCIYLIF